MERTIGNLGEEIWQPSKPYANLSQRGLIRNQVNALIAMVPDLVPPLWIFLTVRLTWNEAMSSFVLRIDTAKLWTFMSPKHLRTISVGHLLGVWEWCVLQLLAGLVFDFRMGRLHNLDGKKNVCH